MSRIQIKITTFLIHEVLRKAWCKVIDVTSTFGGNKEVATNSRIISPRRMVSRKARKGAKARLFFATKALRHKVSRMSFTQSSQRGKGAKVLFSFPPLGD